MKEDAGEETSNEIKEALKLVEDELEKTKNDYKDYQDSVKDYTDKPEDKEEDSAIPNGDDDEERSILGDEEGDSDSEEVENQPICAVISLASLINNLIFYCFFFSFYF